MSAHEQNTHTLSSFSYAGLPWQLTKGLEHATLKTNHELTDVVFTAIDSFPKAVWKEFLSLA
jgi:hypothetical protein